METVRRRLNIKKWLLFGGSWGATLALIYTLTHPDRVLGLLLRGTFLARGADLEWFFFGLKRLLPQAWARLSSGMTNCSGSQELIEWFYQALHNAKQAAALQAARSWSEWGSQVVHWHHPDTAETVDREGESETQRARLLAKVGIETHYAQHRYFIDDNEILDRITNLPELPVTIVHGRFDLTCPLESAWLLHSAIPGSRFVEVPEAGHLLDEPAMTSVLLQETDRMLGILTPVRE
jgi:proline iminopeptidase